MKTFTWRTSSKDNNASLPADLLMNIRSASDWIRHEAGESANDIARLDTPPEDVTTASWQALAFFTYSRRLEMESRREEAVSALRSALQEDPNFALAYARLGDILVNLGNLNEDYESYLKALDRSNVDRLSLRERDQIQGNYALDTRNFEAAESAFREYSALYDHDYFGWFRRALPLLMLDRPEEAIRVLERAHETNPNNPGAVMMLFRLHLVLDDTAGARKWMKEVTVMHASDEADYEAGALAFMEGNYPAALSSFHKLLRRPRSSTACRHFAGWRT